MTAIAPGAPRAARPLDEIELAAWIGQAAPGDALEYHCGLLALDVCTHASRLPEDERQALRRLAARAWWASEQRLVHLVQSRLGPDRFRYLAIVRPRPKAAEAPLSALLLRELAA